MRAVIVPEPGGPEALTVTDVDPPVPGPDEVLVKVSAAGVNRADTLQRQGFYDPPAGATPVLGLEAAGHVEAIGKSVTTWQVGDRVMALLTGGGYAEYVAVPAGQLIMVPDNLDLIAAAGVMETYATVWSNLFMVAGLRAGQTLLVHGGGSGIGTTAIGLAKARGVRVLTTVGSEGKAEACRRFGADVVINYREQDFVTEVRDLGGADVILDIMGAKYLERNLRALNTGGHLVVIGLQGGIKAELNLGMLLTKRASVTATSLRARPAEEKAEIVAQLVEHVLPLLKDGTIAPVVDSTFPLAQVADAHRHLEESAHIGKVILTIDS